MTFRDGEGGPRCISLPSLIVFQWQVKETAGSCAQVKPYPFPWPPAPTPAFSTLPSHGSFPVLARPSPQLFKYVMQTHEERERVWMVSRETGEGGTQIPDFKTTLESLAVSLSSMCGQQSLPPPTGHVEVSPCSSNKFQHPPQC